MTRNPTRALIRDVDDGLDDVQRAAAKAGARIAGDARQAVVSAVAESKDVAQRAAAIAKARPGATLAVAAAIGTVVAFLLRSRRSRR